MKKAKVTIIADVEMEGKSKKENLSAIGEALKHLGKLIKVKVIYK